MLQPREILTARERKAAADFLGESGLLYPDQADFGLAWYDGPELAATGFLGGDVVMGVCVTPRLRGQGVSQTVVGALASRAVSRGSSKAFLFTKPTEVRAFQASGFSLVAVAQDHAALLDWGSPSFGEWLDRIKADPAPGLPVGAVALDRDSDVEARLGLLERAAAQCGLLYAFTRELDGAVRSLPGLPGCRVVPAGRYLAALSRFPVYFTGPERCRAAHAALDCELFARRMAPELGVTIRFTLPDDDPEGEYGRALLERLPRAGIEVRPLRGEPAAAHAEPEDHP